MNRTPILLPIRTLLSLAVLVAIAVASIGLDPASAAKSSTTPSTEPSVEQKLAALKPWKPTKQPARAWDRVADGIAADGTVSKKVALQAFELTIGDLPGVATPKGKSGGTDSATAALWWIGTHLDELTPEQRAAVADALTPVDIDGRPVPEWDSPAPVRHGKSRATAGSIPIVRGCWGEEVVLRDAPGAQKYRSVLDQEQRALEAHLGPLSARVFLIFSAADGKALASATAYSEGCSAAPTSCTIRLMPSALTLPEGEEMPALLAHELTHCFQSQVAGIREAQKLAPWIVEGYAEWTANALHPNGSHSTVLYWKDYLESPRQSLYSRSYDAVGFYEHVESVGGNPWSTFIAATRSPSNVSAFDAIVSSSRSAFSETWGSSYARDASRGHAWDEHATGVPASDAAPAIFNVANGSTRSMGATEVSNGLWLVKMSADVVQFAVGGDRLGRVSWDGGSDAVVTSIDGDLYCARAGGCKCPDGTGPNADPIPGELAMVAVTGTGGSSLVEVTGLSLDDFCEDVAGPVDECLIGTWTSGTFTIPGPLPGYTPEGGAGAVVRISRDGNVDWDFTAMEAMVSTDTQIRVTTAIGTTGTAHGRVDAHVGIWDTSDVDVSAMTGRMKDTVLGERPLAGGPGLYVMIGDGTYSCGTNSFTYSSVDPVENAAVNVTMTKRS